MDYNAGIALLLVQFGKRLKVCAIYTGKVLVGAVGPLVQSASRCNWSVGAIGPSVQ